MSRAFPLLAALLLLAACAPAPTVAPAPVVGSIIAPMPGADRNYGPGPALSNPPPPAPAKEFVELENPPDGTRIAVKQGGELKLIIDARPMNQLQWKQVAAVAPTLSPIGGRAYVSKSTNLFDISAGGWNIFRFRAEKPGTVALVLELAATDVPQPSARTIRYEVTVE